MKKSTAVIIATLAFAFTSCRYEGNTYIIYQEKERETFPVTIAELETRTVIQRTLDGEGNIIDGSLNSGATLGFMESKEDIPFIIFDDFCLEPDLYEISPVNEDTKIVTIKNKISGGSLTANLCEQKLTFDNLDAFFQDTDSYNDFADSQSLDYLEMTSFKNIAGPSFQIDLNKYGIPMIIAKTEKGYFLALPIQTFNDIFLSSYCNSYVFNGKYIYISSKLAHPLLQEDCYNSAPKKGSRTRSQELTDYCYRELCLNLDFNYGLKEIHGINFFQDFDSYFDAIGLKEDLQNQDSLVFSTALTNFINNYLNDIHSDYGVHSFYVPQEITVDRNNVSESRKKKNESEVLYYLTRNSDSEDIGSPCLEISKDGKTKTAILRFDDFECNYYDKDTIENAALILEENYMDRYAGNPELENTIDTICLIHLLNKKIKEQSTDIENVVLDLSNNGGGTISAGVFVLAWMLGECTLNVQNTISGARFSSTYRADVNLDGKYDSEDTICDKNLFCLISPVSFSCANDVAAVLKESGRVTLLGQSSSGGTATVHFSNASDGTVFSLSSKYVSSIEKNGSYYDIDRGVEPHYVINNPKDFYNVEKIANLVDSINEGKITPYLGEH